MNLPSVDIVVAGGGPAGATLAICAGRMGLRVALFDKARFPRDKACGEGLMPAGVGVLRRLGLHAALAAGQPFHGIRYRGFGICAETTFAAGDSRKHPSDGDRITTGLGLRRMVFDSALLQAARDTPNVQVYEDAPVENVAMERGRAVGLCIAGTVVRARLVVGADGARSPVRRALALDGAPDRRPRMGLRRHFQLSPRQMMPRLVEVFIGADHEVYLTPLPNGQVMVAALGERPAGGDEAPDAASKKTKSSIDTGISDLAAVISRHPALAELLDGALPITNSRGCFPLRHRAVAGVAPGAVLVGDAAGFCDPITGGGMSQALMASELLANYLPRLLATSPGDDEWLWRFDRARRRLFRDYVVLTNGLLAMSRHAATARFALRTMRAQPAMMRRLVGVAAGTAALLPRPFASGPI